MAGLISGELELGLQLFNPTFGQADLVNQALCLCLAHFATARRLVLSMVSNRDEVMGLSPREGPLMLKLVDPHLRKPRLTSYVLDLLLAQGHSRLSTRTLDITSLEVKRQTLDPLIELVVILCKPRALLSQAVGSALGFNKNY